MNTFQRTAALAASSLLAVAAQAAGFYEVHTVSPVALSAAPGDVTLLQVTVPAGKWAVNAKANIVNWGAKDYNRCAVYVGTTLVNGSAIMTGEAGGMPAVAQIDNLGSITTYATEVFRFQCGHDFAVANQYADPGAVLRVSKQPK